MLTFTDALRGLNGRAAPGWFPDRLAEVLAAEGVLCCEWKGLRKRSRWATGQGDLDLLVDRRSAPRLAAALEGLGFKLALPAGELQVPGVLSYLGTDPILWRLLHIHVHYELLIGRAWTSAYRLPLERPVLESSVGPGPLRTPAPEFELVLLVLRSTIRHDLRDLVRPGEPPWIGEIRTDLDRLEPLVPHPVWTRVLDRHLPEVEPDTFERCLASLRAGCPPWRRLAARLLLQRKLRATARRPPRRVLGWRILQIVSRPTGWPRQARLWAKRLATGGAVVALVGCDGSGKSTCARALEGWLAPELRVRRVHLGHPPRSVLTLVVGAALRVARWLDARFRRGGRSGLTDHLTLARFFCTARDRHRLSRRVRRFAVSGGIAICERYPIPENSALVGPSETQGFRPGAPTRLTRALQDRERRRYHRIPRPDLILVLHTDPDTAVARKTTEPADYVRARARLLREIDWSRSGAVPVDATLPLADVVAELRYRIWETL